MKKLIDKNKRRARNRHKRAQEAKRKQEWVIKRSHELRANPPKSEKWFMDALIENDLDGHFKNNIEILGKYIVDFLHISRKLIIEVDGSIHENEEVILKDAERHAEIEEAGYKVIRVRAYDEESLHIAINKIYILLRKNPEKRKTKSKVKKRPPPLGYRQEETLVVSNEIVKTASYTEEKCHLCERTHNLTMVIEFNHYLRLCAGHNGYYNQIKFDYPRLKSYLKL